MIPTSAILSTIDLTRLVHCKDGNEDGGSERGKEDGLPL